MAIILNQEKNELVIGVREIKTNFLGLSILGELSSCLLQVNPGPVTLNFQNLTWFDAHLCSALGALLLRHGDHLFKFVGLPQKVDEIFRRNGFNTFYGAEALSDGWGSTMQFRKFNNSDTFDKIAEYLEIELANKSVPIMSPQLRDHFIQSISEIFQNSCIHSRTPDNYCICGQYFHQSGLLNITFSDTGVGFARNFLDYIGEQIAPHEAIAWSVKKGNSTSRNVGLSNILDSLV